MRKASVLVAIVLVIFVAAGAVWAQMDIFMKIDDIKGESTDSKHMDMIDVLSWSWGMTNPSAAIGGGGAGTGKVEFQNLAITKFLDRATPKLFQAMTTGQHLKEATMYLVGPGEKSITFFELKLSDILVTSLSHSASASGSDLRPLEQFSLNFGKVEMIYRPQNPDGSAGSPIQAVWDLSNY